MATTTNYSWNLPTVGGNQDAWGSLLNDNWSALDTLLGGVSSTELAILDGATVTTAELNILDGVTATATEINVLDGITATTTELNYTDGVTSNIQTQLNALSSGKQNVDATLTAYAGTLTAVNKIPYATSVDVAGELDFKDEDDMASNSATAVPSQQSVKAYVDAQAYTQPTTLAAVGTYAFCKASTNLNPGDTISGANLDYSNAYGDSQGNVGVGTWRCMGGATSTTAGAQRATLFLRIS